MVVTFGGIFDVEGKQSSIASMEATMAEPGFWDDQEQAQKTVTEMNHLKRAVAGVVDFNTKLEDMNAIAELVEEEETEEDGEFSQELRSTADSLFSELEELEIASFLSGPHDRSNAFLTIHSGAGGTESCDWAEMLYRMYTRWAERNDYTVEVQDMQQGEEAGLSRVTMMISGLNAYGYAKAELGLICVALAVRGLLVANAWSIKAASKCALRSGFSCTSSALR